MHWRASFTVAVAVLLASCSNNQTNPFASQTRPPSSDSVVMFVSSSWSSDKGAGREILATNANGSKVERLTSCALASEPCDVVQVAVSITPNRVAVVRSLLNAAPGTAALYFVDLSRSAEKQIFPRKRVSSVDWAADASYLLYTSTADVAGEVEDIFLCYPDGTNDQNLTATTSVRERNPRSDPLGRTAAFELIEPSGVSRIYFYGQTSTPLFATAPDAGPALPGTPYVVGSDADPVFSPTGDEVAFRRLVALGNGGLGQWDILRAKVDGSGLTTVATGPLARSAPDWSTSGLVFVETDAAAGKSRLVTIKADGTGRQVVLEEDAGYQMGSPRWIPGRTIQ